MRTKKGIMVSLWMLKSPLEILLNVQLQVKIFQKTDPIPKLVCYQDHASQSSQANTYHSISRISYNFFSLAFVNSDHNSGLNLNGTLWPSWKLCVNWIVLLRVHLERSILVWQNAGNHPIMDSDWNVAAQTLCIFKQQTTLSMGLPAW